MTSISSLLPGDLLLTSENADAIVAGLKHEIEELKALVVQGSACAQLGHRFQVDRTGHLTHIRQDGSR